MALDTEFDQRRRWPVWLVVAVVLAALVLGVVMWWTFRAGAGGGGGTPSGSPSASPTAVPSTPAPRPSETGLLGNTYADGCRGGSGRDGAMVLAAQQMASEDDKGAAEFAASYTRWSAAFPPAAPIEVDRVLSAVAAPDAGPAVTDLAQQQQTAAEAVDFTELALTTVGGRYYVESSEGDRVVVSVVLPVGNTDADLGGAGYNAAGTYTLVRSDQGWLIQDVSRDRTPDDLLQIGYAFVGGC